MAPKLENLSVQLADNKIRLFFADPQTHEEKRATYLLFFPDAHSERPTRDDNRRALHIFFLFSFKDTLTSDTREPIVSLAHFSLSTKVEKVSPISYEWKMQVQSSMMHTMRHQPEMILYEHFIFGIAC